MLPFLLGGVVLGLGKLIYDAVTEDEKTSSSSSGPSEAEIKRARREERDAQRARTSAELITETAEEVRALLNAHKAIVAGRAKPGTGDISGATTLRPAAAWPFPTDSVSSTGAADDGGTIAALSLDDLRKTAKLEGQVQGVDALRHLTIDLRYQEKHLKKEQAVAQLVAERNALKALAESL